MAKIRIVHSSGGKPINWKEVEEVAASIRKTIIDSRRRDNMATKPKNVIPLKTVGVQIKEPNFRTVTLRVVGTTPYVQNKFSNKAKQKMADSQEAGGVSKSKRTREPKNFEEGYKGAMHISHEGWYGQSATGYRKAMISACRTVGFKMTHAKLGFTILADGFDAEDESPLVRILEGEPHPHRSYTILANGNPDIIDRPMWRKWTTDINIRFDADMFSLDDIANLLSRAGQQVGIGCGRQDSKSSAGCGWGMFELQRGDV